MYSLLTLSLFFAVVLCDESVTLECQYPATSHKLDVCKLANIEGDFSNKDVVLSPRIGKPVEIKIKHVHLGRIPPSILRDHADIKELTIKNGSVYSLEGVDQLKQLEELELPHNNLSEITENHFNNPVLDEISLEHNQIEIIHPNAFKNTPNLKKLELNDNKIRTLYRSVIVDTLESIELEDNLIENIDNLFANHALIKKIDLQGNQIQKIISSTFENCPNLYKLDLSHNKIEIIEDGAFDHIESLQLLDLKKNKLKSFSMNIVNAFMGNLFIGDNELTQLSIKMSVPELKRKFTLEAQRNQLTEVDIPETIIYKKIKLHTNPLTKLPSGLTFKTTEFVYLDNIDLSSADLTFIPQLTNLVTMSLNNTNIGPDVFKSLLEHPTVHLIDVSHNAKLHDFDFSTIKDGGKHIEHIEMNFCGVTEVDIEAVKKAFPKLKSFRVLGDAINYDQANHIEKEILDKGKSEKFN